jgi:methyltransferase (TIGR00027 family)
MANPISKTAYYTLSVRAWDAKQPKPVCGDNFASTFMNEEADAVWKEFKELIRPNSSNAARHTIIDQDLQKELQENPDAQIIIIGAGFDTRAFRFGNGKWIEVDEPSIIEYKNNKLPASKAPNFLQRIPINFSEESLSSKLLPFSSDARTFIILEGVLMYLTEKQRQDLLKTLQSHFKNNVIYCDLMRNSFFKRYSQDVHEKIKALGASFTDMIEHPEQLFLDYGYQALSKTSIPLYAASHSRIGIPPFMVRYVLGTLRNGYCIWKFEYSAIQ